MATPVIDGYSGLEEIGEGGFATVYRARQDRLDRQVALKVLRAKNLDEATVRRFERECHAMGDLSWHPNVVGVFDSGVTTDGHPWLTMQFMARGSVADRMRQQGPLPWSEVVDIGVQTAGALGAVHAAGRIHRDVKPENLLVGPFGEVKLADFGIAVVSDATSATAAQFTPGFVSAEVLQGSSPDQRSDVYSLAATLHALIAGHSPFATVKGEPVAALLMRAIQGERPRLGGVPDDLADLIVTCLDTDPDVRPQSAAALGEALQAVQQANGLPVTVLRITAETDPDPTPREAPGDSSATIVGALPDTGDSSATIVGALPDVEDSSAAVIDDVPVEDASATIVGQLPTAPPAAPVVPPPPAPAPAPAPATPPSAAAVAPAAPSGGKKKRTGLLIGAGVVVVVVLLGAVGAVLLGGGGDDDVVATIPIGADVRGVAIDGDNLWVADADANTVSRVDTSSNRVVDTITVGSEPIGVAVSGDDVWVTNSGDGTVTQVSASSGEVVDTISVGRRPGAVAASGDDVWVVNDEGQTPISRIDAPSGSVTNLDTAPQAVSVTVSEDGVWFGGPFGAVFQIDPATNEVTQEITLDGGGRVSGVAVTPGTVWALDTSVTSNALKSSLRRLDPESGDEIDSVALGGVPVAIAAAGDEVFVTNLSEETVTRFDADGLVATYDAGELPEQIALSASGRIYVSDRDQDAVLEIAAGD